MKIERAILGTLLTVALLSGCNQTQPQATTTPSGAATSVAQTPEATGAPADSATPSESGTPGAETSGGDQAFEKTLELQEHTFLVKRSGNEVTVTASGAEQTGEPQTAEVEGSIVDAEIEDLDANGFPEVYIYVTSDDDKKSGRLIAFASNNGKSITPIYLPPLEQVEGTTEGYRGGDELRVVENRLVQRWDVYKEGDEDGKPSGGTRQVQWRLEPGEATWTLVSDKVESY